MDVLVGGELVILQFINVKHIKDYVKSEYGKRVGRDFLLAVDSMVKKKIDKAGKVHNGGKKTLDGGVAIFAGIK